VTIFRAMVFHAPPGGLQAHADGALAVEAGKIVACGDYPSVSKAHSQAEVRDLRGGYLLPGLIDTHVHFPQIRILGGFGYELLDWLKRLTLPEEERLADQNYAQSIAREFVNGLLSHGTTTALAFGSHFSHATAALFEAAGKSGLRLFSGLVLSDRNLSPKLHISPDQAHRQSCDLIQRFDRRGRLRYTVMPRFALSTSEPMLEVCRTLLEENPALGFTTHINENSQEIAEVRRMFPWAGDYLEVYERFKLLASKSVLAHNVHSTDAEIMRIASLGATVAHCPASNAALGSGIFPLARHRHYGARVALGTDVGGGVGFGILKEALQAYLMQRVAAEPLSLSPGDLLYLATRAGAEALGIEKETGDFQPGKQADFIYLRPPDNSTLAAVLQSQEDPHRALSAIFTLAGAESIQEVRIGGDLVYDHRTS
jgi:guanine deaminase